MTFGEYVGLVKDIAVTTLKGMGVTWRVFVSTNQEAVYHQYPETGITCRWGRAVCFSTTWKIASCKQCAIACPVDCIYIEADKNPRWY
ncbi:MAG: hypothetical protein R3B54_08095 [Bdellovibrionota bacterium]